MPRALELVSGVFAAAVALPNFSTAAPVAGDSFTVRNAAPGSRVYLLTYWADLQASGAMRLRSPSLHDNVQGLRSRVMLSEPLPLIEPSTLQQLRPQDTLIMELSEAATAGDLAEASYLVYYEDLPGVDGRFIDVAELERRSVNLVSVENSITAGMTGAYTGAEAINAEFDLLRAGTWYAILGYVVTTECCSVRYRCADFGNLGVGGPGHPNQPIITNSWFVDLSRKTGLPTIPTFHSANKGSLLIDVLQDENSAGVAVTTILAQLSE